MEKSEKRIGYPKTAYELFLKLYIKKNGSSEEQENILVTATNAWITLNEEEKQTFKEKYNECKKKHQNIIANNLEKLKPYMKKKQPKRLSEVESKCKSPVNNRDSVDFPIDEDPEDNTANSTALNSEISEITTLEEQHSSTKVENVEEYDVPVLSEPIPPNVRNSIDLFNMIQCVNGESESDWASLSTVEKMRYRKAVLELKKGYIKNYKLYLESLPPKELFKYYHRFERNVE